MNLAQLKRHVTANSPIYILVFSYFMTAILANILYLTPFARNWPALSIPNFSWAAFQWPLDIEFWALALLLPMVAPPVALFTGRATAPLAKTISKIIPELSLVPYTAICLVLYAFVFYELHRVHAWQLLVSAGDQIGAVEARFAVLAGLGFMPNMVMKSLLVFLAVYAVVRAIREGGVFWWIFVLWHIGALSICLMLLNMKWPVVLFVVTLGLCVFVTAKRYPVAKSGLVVTAGVATYLFMSAVLLRIVPVAQLTAEEVHEVEKTTEQVTISDKMNMNAAAKLLQERGIDLDTNYAVDAMNTGIRFAPHLLIAALNRMAISVPYYYDVFKSHGPICGTYGDRIMRRPSPCAPSIVVYTRMFGLDGFEGRGTAPGAPNLNGFALDGWGGALVCTVLTGIVLGLFLALWPSANHIYATAFIMGGYTAYFFSQLPFEGPLVYDHGMLWWMLLVLGWTALYWLQKAVRRFAIRDSQPSGFTMRV